MSTNNEYQINSLPIKCMYKCAGKIKACKFQRNLSYKNKKYYLFLELNTKVMQIMVIFEKTLEYQKLKLLIHRVIETLFLNKYFKARDNYQKHNAKNFLTLLLNIIFHVRFTKTLINHWR
jgi:hypothetical protein